ncbi:MAG: tRNA (adenosine(37)-N6)-dimethylallyltransferase MiaA [Phycisphaerales bacterium]|nr:tRNA (adenosine(37)-N6)-dimethylallyltransferase MiaA [Phycisphaerales bacterium]
MSESNQPTLIVIAGPTAVGKTAVAIDLAKHLGTEILSADSRQCYQGMRIGTAQPNADERAQVVHHFVDCYAPEKELSAADFECEALSILDTIFINHQSAIVCGGTGLYIKALCEGLDDMPNVDPLIQTRINEEYAQQGIEWLRSSLRITDPVFFAQGEVENPARMLRALIFSLSTGKSITEFRTGIKKNRAFRIIKIGLELPRAILYERINIRVEQMIKEGLVEEVQQLLTLKNCKNLNTVGYSEIFDFLDGKASLQSAIDKVKQHSRNYAKRQLTWFKRDLDFQWFAADETNLTEKISTLVHSIQ